MLRTCYLAALLLASLLIAAPVPPARPIADPVAYIERLDARAASLPEMSLSTARDQLRNRLAAQLERLADDPGRREECARLRACLHLSKTVRAEYPLGSVADLLHRASVGGTYSELSAVLLVPGDGIIHRGYYDYGYWEAIGDYHGFTGTGWWVYVQPRWFAWKKCAQCPTPPGRKE